MKLAPRISHLEVPRCYYAARHSLTSNNTVLLLEDLSLTCDVLVRSSSIEDSTIFSLIKTIASMHAEFYEHPMLQYEELDWLPTLSSTLSYYKANYEKRICTKSYMAFLHSKVSSKAYDYAIELSTHFTQIFHKLSDEKYTLSHGDFCINNVLMRHDQPQRFVILDWQTCCRANGLIDIAFLLRMCGNKRAFSLELHALKLYHEVLVKYGISQYDLSSIRDDYYTLVLPFIFIRFCCWDHTARNKIKDIACILEDVVTYKKANKQPLCNSGLTLYRSKRKDRSSE